MSGQNVSHSNRKTKRTFEINGRIRSLFSPVLGNVRLYLSCTGVRTVEKYGGIDAYLLSQKLKHPALLKLRKRLERAMSKKASNAHLQQQGV
jgi:large subunit ribosomal protein L28